MARKRKLIRTPLGRIQEVYADVLTLRELLDEVANDVELRSLHQIARRDASVRRVLDETFVGIESTKGLEYSRAKLKKIGSDFGDAANYWRAVDLKLRGRSHDEKIATALETSESISTKGRPNVLCSGVKVIRGDIDNRFPNVALNKITSGPWERAFESLRPRWLYYLLTCCSLFEKLPNTCLLQLCGSDVSSIIGKLSKKDCSVKSNKLSKNSNTKSTPMQVPKVCSMYGCPEIDSTGHCVFGMPKRHVLGPPRNSSGDCSAVSHIGAVLSTIFPKDAKRGNGRLEMVSKLLEFTLSRHAKTPYDLLVRKYCPSETAHSTYYQVETLFKVILRRVLAWDLLGSTHNWDLLFLYVGKFVRLRKFELLRLDHLINSLRVTDIAWLAATNRNERMCRAEFEKRRQLLGNVVSFIFQNFIPTFLKANFYATEMGADSNSVFYFRHDVWSIREQQVLRSFISSNLQPVPRKSASGNSVFTRVVPKPDGSGRVITKFKAANEHLKLLQTVLKQTVWDVDDLPSHVRYQKNPHTFAAKRERPFYTIRALRDFLPRLESFRRRIMAGRKVVPPVFIVKTDISRCYDTLNRDMALDNADSILRRADAFWLYRFKMFNCRVLSPKYYGRFESIARYDDLSLDDVVHGIAKARALSIIIDNQPKELLSSAGLSSVLEAHLNKTTVRINRRPFKHIKGVPQGSCVSSVLCDIVYDAFLREHMKFDARTTILFRYVDDFLLISTDLNAAESFLSAMTNGFPEYGVHINPAKTVTNFAPHLERPNGTSDTVNFLGIGIEVRSLLPVFRVLESRSAIASSLSYGGGPAGHVLASKITRYLSHRLHRHSTTLIRLPEHRRLAYCCNICRNIGSRVSLMVRLWFRFVNPVFLGRVLRWCISRVVLALRASSRPSISKSSTRSIRWACIKGFECELQSPKFESTLKQLRGFYS